MPELDLSRVKRNVAKMVTMGAPESDIDAYISGEGTTVDQVKATALSPAGRISGAFDASGSVRQVDKLHEPFRGSILPVSGDRFGDIHPAVPGLLNDIGGAVQTVGDVATSRTNAMVPDTGQGVTNPVVEDAAKTLAAVALPVNPAFRAGDRAIPGVMRQTLRKEMPAVPTREELRSAGSGGFKQSRSMGVDFDPLAMSNFASTARAYLDREGFSPLNAPNTYNAIQRLERPNAQGVVELSDLHAFRQQLQKAETASDRAAGSKIIGPLDKFTQDPPASTVLAGPAAEAGAIQKEAIGNWAALERSKEVSGRQVSAERRARASNSGRNIDNTLRQRVASLLDQVDKGQMRGFSQDEIAGMNDFVNGRPTRNASRAIANILGGGGGMGTLLAGGIAGAIGGLPAVLAVPAAGFGAKITQNALGRRAIGKLDESIRMRSPLYQSRLNEAPFSPPSSGGMAVPLRGPMLYGPGSSGGQAPADSSVDPQAIRAAGEKFVSSPVKNEDARKMLASLPPAERQHFAQGFMDSLMAQIEQTGKNRREVIDAIFRKSKVARQRVEIALGVQQARKLEAALRTHLA